MYYKVIEKLFANMPTSFYSQNVFSSQNYLVKIIDNLINHLDNAHKSQIKSTLKI